MKNRSISLLSHCLLGGSAVVLLVAGGCTTGGNSDAEPVATEKRAEADASTADASTADASTAKSASKENEERSASTKNSGDWQTAAGIKINWRPSFEEAMSEARRTNKPVIVDFYATWCLPCKLMDKETWSDPSVIRESANWVMVKVDGEKRPDVFSQYSPGSLPTVVFLRPDAKPANGFLGFRAAKDVLKLMRSTYAQATRNMQAT